MWRILRTLAAAVPLAWAAGLLLHRAALAPGAAAAFGEPLQSVRNHLLSDPILGDYHRFLEQVRAVVPPRARVILIGPPHPAWHGPREDHYKHFLLRMLPREVRAVHGRRDIHRRLAWTDYVVVYRTVLPDQRIAGFRCVLDAGAVGAVFRRERARP